MIKRPIFGQDDGLASVAAMQASTSGKTTRFCCSSSLAAAVDATLLCRSPRPATQAGHHFLEACFLCRKPLGSDTIFMYRGDTPFCSEECRREQMKMDGVAEEEEDDWILIDKVNSASRKEAPQKSADKAPNYHVRAGTVSAAG